MTSVFNGLRLLNFLAIPLVPFCLGLLYLLPVPIDPVVLGWKEPIFNLAEILTYLFVMLIAYKRMELINGLAVAVGLAAGRALMLLVAAAVAKYLDPDGTQPMDQMWVTIWVGRPDFFVFQVFMITSVAIPFFGFFYPGFTGQRTGAGTTMIRRPVGEETGLRTGSMIQFNTYAEMNDFIGRTPGLVGYALATNEGLIVSADGRKLPFPLEQTAPRLQMGVGKLHEQQQKGGLSSDELWQFSAQNTLVFVPIKPCFHLILFFPPKTALAEMSGRVAMLRRSVEAFLLDRHAPLARAMAQAA